MIPLLKKAKKKDQSKHVTKSYITLHKRRSKRRRKNKVSMRDILKNLYVSSDGPSSESCFNHSNVRWRDIACFFVALIFSSDESFLSSCSSWTPVTFLVALFLFVITTFEGSTVSTEFAEHLQLPKENLCLFFLLSIVLVVLLFVLLKLPLLLLLVLFRLPELSLFPLFLRSCNAISGGVTRPTRKRLHNADFLPELLTFD